MSTSEIDPLLREQVRTILVASGWENRTSQPSTIAPVKNSFQDKGNVFKLQFADQPSFILKFEHPFFEARLEREAYILEFLSTTDVPAPKLIHTGVCDVYHAGGRFPCYILMEHVDGVPLNWVYYRADREERRVYLRQVVELVGKLSSLQVRPAPGAPAIGAPAGPIRQQDGFVVCHHLAPFANETVGPFSTLAEMFHQQIAFWLDRLRAQQGKYLVELYTAWHILDRAVLGRDVPVCLAHADIAPMNMIVDPQARVIKGVIDWEFAGFYPVDMDFHSLFYYDQHQEWKWCGHEDVLMAGEIMQELHMRRPEGYDERLVWFDLLQLTKDLCQYQQWFAHEPDELKRYEKGLGKRLASFFEAARVKRV